MSTLLEDSPCPPGEGEGVGSRGLQVDWVGDRAGLEGVTFEESSRQGRGAGRPRGSKTRRRAELTLCSQEFRGLSSL